MKVTFRLKGTAGPLLNQTFPLQAETRLGGPGSDIVVTEHPALSASLSVRTEAGEETCWLRLEHLEQGQGAELNGQPVVAGTDLRLQSGDELRLGSSRLLLQAPGRRPRRALGEPVLATRPSAAPDRPGANRPRAAFVAALVGAALALGAYHAGRQLGWW